MCVGFWSLTHPEYALILCANRDEFLARPTVPAHFHTFEPDVADAPPSYPDTTLNDEKLPLPPVGARVLSGRDLVAGGTWLGLSRHGRLAFLTNITEPPPETPYSSSRGHLLESFLLSASHTSSASSSESVADAAEFLVRKNAHTAYAGFNLLLFDAASPSSSSFSERAQLITNGGGGGPLRRRALSPEERACGGLSNAADGSGVVWPKVKQGTAVLRETLDGLPSGAREEDLAERLFALLALHPDPALPLSRQQSIAIPPRAGTPSKLAYGTRVSTVVLISRSRSRSDKEGRREGQKVYFAERPRWALDGEEGGVREVGREAERVFRFRLDVDVEA